MMKTILILAANPIDTPRLRLDQEVREIDIGLQRAQKRDDFVLKQVWAARPIDIRRALLDFKPNIVHFCGHGAGDEGIAFEDDSGNSKLVSAEALAEFFKLFANTVECIVLNACYSEVQAEAIAQYIEYVIGMKKGIEDTTAIDFAVAFYDGLGAGKSIKFAYELARNAISWGSFTEDLIPQLKNKQTITENIEIFPTHEQPSIARSEILESIIDYHSLIEDKTRDFIGRKFIFDALNEFTDDNEAGYFLIKGEPGIGKTSIAAELIRKYQYIHHFVISTQGIVTTEQFIRNIFAQVFLRYPIGMHLPSAPINDGNLLMKILEDISLLIKNREEKVVIVVDALDEVEQLNHSEANVLYLPPHLPRNIYFVLTSRLKDQEVLPLDFATSVREIYIQADSENNLLDLEEYLKQQVKRHSLRRQLEQGHISVDDFITLMKLCSEGNFMYLRFVLP